jgi:sodium-dependent dicarboxylate transporter 2/3/5
MPARFRLLATGRSASRRRGGFAVCSAGGSAGGFGARPRTREGTQRTPAHHMIEPDRPSNVAVPGFALRINGRTLQRLGLAAGPTLALIVWLVSGGDAGTLAPAGRATMAVATLMVCWWLTDAIPLPATALLPIVLFPLLGASTITETTAAYSEPVAFLLLGGFLLGLALQKWGLHRRIALLTLLAIGAQPARVVAGFMLAAAFLSTWISSTVVAIMMLPIGLSVLETLAGRLGGQVLKSRDPIERFAPALLLGIAYAASIGGLVGLVGTPPNLVLATFVERHCDTDLSALAWLSAAVPLIVILLPLAWLYLTHLVFPLHGHELHGGRDVLHGQLIARGPMSRGEWVVLTVFGLTALGWALQPALAAWTEWPGFDDAVIAMTGALALFVIPVDRARGRFAMDWETAKSVPWGILILLGGGLTLAAAIERNGVGAFLASSLTALGDMPVLWRAVATAALAAFLTEITGKAATTATVLPVLAAAPLVMDPQAGPLLLAATLAAGCGFMLPVAAAPNAVVLASGRVRAGQMAWAGLGLKLIAIVLISALTYLAPLGTLF